MDFVNYNLGASSCSEFFEMSGYPIGADPMIDEMCCGTISGMSNGDGDCTDNTPCHSMTAQKLGALP